MNFASMHWRCVRMLMLQKHEGYRACHGTGRSQPVTLITLTQQLKFDVQMAVAEAKTVHLT